MPFTWENPLPLEYAHDAAQTSLGNAVAADRQSYQRNFAPGALQLRRIALGMDEGNEYEQSVAAGKDSNRAFGSAQGQYERDLFRRGVSTNDGAASGQRKRLGLGRIIAQVDAQNGASRTARSNQQMAQTFGIQNYGELITNSNNILGNIAKSEVDRYAQWRGANAAGNSSAAGAIGAVASFI
jgi:hypothetical protein